MFLSLELFRIFRIKLILSKRRSISSNNNNDTTKIVYLIFWKKIQIILRKNLRMINFFKIKLFNLQPVTKLFTSQRMIKKMR
ncbi:hypothetical protein AHAS_Ahas19G0167300 [Arachis hypogaea]